MAVLFSFRTAIYIYSHRRIVMTPSYPQQINYGQPMAPADYGCSILPQVLQQLYQSSQISIQEYTYLQNLWSSDRQMSATLYNNLQTTYGNFQLNPTSVQNSVKNFLLNAVQNLRRNAAMNQPQQPMYGGGYQQIPFNGPYQNAPNQYYGQNSYNYNSYAAYQQPTNLQSTMNNTMLSPSVTSTTKMPPQSAAQAVAAQNEQNEPINIKGEDEIQFCGEVTTELISDDDNTPISVPNIIEITPKDIISCSQCHALHTDVRYIPPVHDARSVLAQLFQTKYQEAISPERSFITIAEWYQVHHFSHLLSESPKKLLDACSEMYANGKSNIGKTVSEIYKYLKANGGEFGNSISKILMDEVNKYASVVFSMETIDGNASYLEAFDDFADFQNIWLKNNTFDKWKQPKAPYHRAISKILSGTFGRFFSNTRSIYLKSDSTEDRFIFETDQFLPYTYKDIPLYLVPYKDRTEDYEASVSKLMDDSMSIIVPQRMMIFNLPLSTYEQTENFCFSTSVGPAEKILTKIYETYGVMEAIDVSNDNNTVSVFGCSYNNHPVFKIKS